MSTGISPDKVLDKSLARLNPEQKRAVLTTEGRVLVLAGAGSGKTSVLTHRAAYLLLEKGVVPQSILGLTFTNKAAAEMRMRLSQLVGPVASKVTLSTFHSFCMSLLREEIHHLGYTRQFSLYSEKEVKRLLDQIARELLQHEGAMPSLAPTYDWIAKQRGQGNNTSPQEEDRWHDQFARSACQELAVAMRACNAVDFDSLLSLTLELFQNRPEVAAPYQERYRYLMIDEYQDTNPVQDRLAALLAKRHGNLCVVGDDDQSIYGWRGAEVRNILEFRPDTTIKLEQNYRSTPTILGAANAVIARNQERLSKSLWSPKERGEPITLFHAATEKEEARSVVERMIWLHKHRKMAWGEMAVLYRSNILSREVELALASALWEKDGRWIRGIPCEVFGGTELTERTEVRDVMAFLRLVANPLDQEALLRIANVPRRGISQNALDLLTQKSRKEGIPLWSLMKQGLPELSDQAKKGCLSFVAAIDQARDHFATLPLEEALQLFLERIDYKKAIQEEVKSEAMRAFKWENVQLCQRALKQYREESSHPQLAEFVATTLLDDTPLRGAPSGNDADKVHLMTFHSAKGLEFSACFLIGLEDHIIPHEKSVKERGLEEERRLFYVALTRAKTLLTLSMATSRRRMGKEHLSQPSRLIFEIPKELLRVVSSQTTHY